MPDDPDIFGILFPAELSSAARKTCLDFSNCSVFVKIPSFSDSRPPDSPRLVPGPIKRAIPPRQRRVLTQNGASPQGLR
jgi:hypothetical protein